MYTPPEFLDLLCELRDLVLRRPLRSGFIAAMALFVVVVVTARGPPLEPGSMPAEPQARGAAVALRELATIPSPVSRLYRPFDTAATVEQVDLPGRTLLAAAGEDHLTVAVSEEAMRGLTTGAKIQLRGVFVGRSRLGRVYLQGQSIHPADAVR